MLDEVEFLRWPPVCRSPLSRRWRFPPRGGVVAAMPIVVDGPEFTVHPGGEGAPIGAWRPVVAIREGIPSDDDYRAAVCGEFIDCAALSLSCDRVIATMSGLADAMGNPASAYLGSFRDAPLRLRRTPADWLSDLQGACLTRPLSDSIDFIRGFASVICDDVKHGDAVRAALRRDFTGPEIRVVAPRREAA